MVYVLVSGDESFLDSGVITKVTLLSFKTLPSDPERAVGPTQPYRVPRSHFSWAMALVSISHIRGGVVLV